MENARARRAQAVRAFLLLDGAGTVRHRNPLCGDWLGVEPFPRRRGGEAPVVYRIFWLAAQRGTARGRSATGPSAAPRAKNQGAAALEDSRPFPGRGLGGQPCDRAPGACLSGRRKAFPNPHTTVRPNRMTQVFGLGASPATIGVSGRVSQANP